MSSGSQSSPEPSALPEPSEPSEPPAPRWRAGAQLLLAVGVVFDLVAAALWVRGTRSAEASRWLLGGTLWSALLLLWLGALVWRTRPAARARFGTRVGATQWLVLALLLVFTAGSGLFLHGWISVYASGTPAGTAVADAGYHALRLFALNLDAPPGITRAEDWMGSALVQGGFWALAYLAPALLLGSVVRVVANALNGLQIGRRTGHLVICGAGDVATSFLLPSVCDTGTTSDILRKRPVVIDADPTRREPVEATGADFVCGDPKQPHIRRRARIGSAALVVVATEDERANRLLAGEVHTAGGRKAASQILFATTSHGLSGLSSEASAPQPFDLEQQIATAAVKTVESKDAEVVIVSGSVPRLAVKVALALKARGAPARRVVGPRADAVVTELELLVPGGERPKLESGGLEFDALDSWDGLNRLVWWVTHGTVTPNTVVVATGDDDETIAISEALFASPVVTATIITVTHARHDGSRGILNASVEESASAPTLLMESEQRASFLKAFAQGKNLRGLRFAHRAPAPPHCVVHEALRAYANEQPPNAQDSGLLDKMQALHLSGLAPRDGGQWDGVASQLRGRDDDTGKFLVCLAECESDVASAADGGTLDECQGLTRTTIFTISQAGLHGTSDMLDAAITPRLGERPSVPVNAAEVEHVRLDPSEGLVTLREKLKKVDPARATLVAIIAGSGIAVGDLPAEEHRPVIAAVALARACGIPRIAWVDVDPAGSPAESLAAALPSSTSPVLPLIGDRMTLRSWLTQIDASGREDHDGPFAAPPRERLRLDEVDALAAALQSAYVEQNRGQQSDVDLARQAWSELSEPLRESNRDAARDWANKRRAVPRLNDAESVVSLSDQDLDLLAEMEHGRYVRERTAAGWRTGSRAVALKRSSTLVPWSTLVRATSEAEKDRDVIRECLRWEISNRGIRG